MGQLFKTSNSLLRGKIRRWRHASERLEERGIMEWQTVAALADGEFDRRETKVKPNPTIEVRESLPMARNFKAVGLTCGKAMSPSS